MHGDVNKGKTGVQEARGLSVKKSKLTDQLSCKETGLYDKGEGRIKGSLITVISEGSAQAKPTFCSVKYMSLKSVHIHISCKIVTWYRRR